MVISILLVALVLIGISAYYTSAWFGCQSSGMTQLPPHYTHLAKQNKEITGPVKQSATTGPLAKQPIDQ